MNPITGVMYDNPIFIGPIYYQRLRHMVMDKVYERGTGRIDAQTRQPMKGRVRNGGLRFGEMERDCILSHGMVNILQERMLYVSDSFDAYVCKICGLLALSSPVKNVYTCRKCGRKNNISLLKIPYSCKQLIQELMAVHIRTSLKLRNQQFL